MIAEASSSDRLCGNYEVVSALSRGPAPRLFCCRQPIPGRSEQLFAVGVIKESDPDVRQSLIERLGPITAVRHPNMVKVHEIIEENDHLFVVQELVRGRSLQTLLVALSEFGMQVPVEIAAWLTARIINGLAAAHAAVGPKGEQLELLHTRLSPSSVLLTSTGQIKIRGIGLAGADPLWRSVPWEHHHALGYLAPEVIEGGPANARSDVFAVGSILYSLLAGRAPFADPSTTATLARNLRANPKPLKEREGLTAELVAVVELAMQRRPMNRFADIAAMQGALAPFVFEDAPLELGLASLTRTAMGELSGHPLLERPKHPSAITKAAPLVCLCSSDEDKRRIVSDVAERRGYWTESHHSPQSLIDGWGIGMNPDVVVIDLGLADLDVRHLRSVVTQSARPVPVIAWGHSLEAEDVSLAHAVGAKDLLDVNAGPNRLIFAIKSAVRTKRRADGRGEAPAPQRLLFVGLDGRLIARILPDLIRAGFAIDVASNTDAALEQAADASHVAVLVDAMDLDAVDDFLEAFRGLPGMGMIPMLLLHDEELHPSQERISYLRRQSPAHELLTALTDLLADTSAGRTFTRFSASIPVELRYGGRTASGEALNLSRGGVLLGVDIAVPLGSLISVAMELPRAGGLQAAARVVRTTEEQLGLEFEHFVADGEPRLIRYLSDLRNGSVDPS